MDKPALQEVDAIWSVIKLLAACVVAAATVVSMIYDRFQTVDDAKSSSAAIERRLERIESKIDSVLLNDRKGN